MDFIYNPLFCCNRTFYCANMVSVTSASYYVMSVSPYQIETLNVHPRSDSTKLAEGVGIALVHIDKMI